MFSFLCYDAEDYMLRKNFYSLGFPGTRLNKIKPLPSHIKQVVIQKNKYCFKPS